MEWRRVDQVAPPAERALRIRTREDGEETVAFVGRDGIWYSGGALVQNSMTVLAATPVEWRDMDEEAEGSANP